MGLIKAGMGAIGGTLADQWLEFFYCDALANDVLVVKGKKRTSGRSSNTRGNDNVITNGSGIAVANGQCMIIVDQGKIVEFCAEPGEYTYNTSSEPSIFTGDLGDGIKQAFLNIGKRFAYGGDAGKDQRVYYFNTKEIMDNKFGTPNPFMFDVVNKEIGIRRTVQVRCNGVYSYKITNPILFYSEVCGNVEQEFTKDEIEGQLKTEFIDALQPAFVALSELQLRPAQIPAHANELKDAMNNTLRNEWSERRGITIQRIALNPITLTEEDMKKINQMEDAASMGSNPFMMAGRMTDATAAAMENAASNPNGSMNGFFGMGMAMNAGGGTGGFQAAQNFYNAGVQQQAAQQEANRQAAAKQQAAQQQAVATDTWKCSCGAVVKGKFCPECGTKKLEPAPVGSWKCKCGATVNGKFCPECGSPKPADDGWTCSCGTVNKGKFCTECGAKKPAGIPLYRCDKCGWEPADPANPPRFCPECGDPFNDEDIQ